MKRDFLLAAVGNPDLPPSNDPNLRWTSARKRAVILHVLDQEYGALKSIEAAVEHYRSTRLSRDELEEWIRNFERGQGSVHGLKVTKTPAAALRHQAIDE